MQPRQVVRWNSATSFVSNSVLSFAFSPLVGDASDAYGRKPFLIAGFLLALLPSAVLAAHLWIPNPGDLLLLYYPASAVSGIVSSIVVCLSYCADRLPSRHRTAGFGLIIAAFSLGFVVGPGIGAALAPRVAAAATLAATLACAAAVAAGVPESLPPAVAAQGERARGGAAGGRGARPAPRRPRAHLHKSGAGAPGTLRPQPSRAAPPHARPTPAPAPAGRQQLASHARPRPLSALLSLARSWALINSRGFFRRLAIWCARPAIDERIPCANTFLTERVGALSPAPL